MCVCERGGGKETIGAVIWGKRMLGVALGQQSLVLGANSNRALPSDTPLASPVQKPQAWREPRVQGPVPGPSAHPERHNLGEVFWPPRKEKPPSRAADWVALGRRVWEFGTPQTLRMGLITIRTGSQFPKDIGRLDHIQTSLTEEPGSQGHVLPGETVARFGFMKGQWPGAALHGHKNEDWE